MTEEVDIKHEYLKEIADEVKNILPGVLFFNKKEEDFMFCFVTEQIHSDMLSIEEDKKDPEKTMIKLDCAPYTISAEDRHFQVELAHPRSKELIIEHFLSNFRKWFECQRTIHDKLGKLLDVWEKALADFNTKDD